MVAVYWASQYVAVFFGYYALMFLWPSYVFRRHLRNKGKLYRFSFCTTVQIVLINTVILGLGLLHILNRWTVLLIFYGILLLSYLRGVSRDAVFGYADRIYRVATGACGVRSFIRGEMKSLARVLRKRWGVCWKTLRPHLGEYIVLSALLVYGMIYFSYGLFQDYSYPFGDVYVHHSWIEGLVNGKIFSGGVYPAGMHCFIYCMHTLFGIKVYSILLFLAGIHTVTFLISVYGLLREVFHSRYIPFFALALFLILDLKSVNAVYAMSRLSYTIPQEFGLFAQFVCARYLVRYLRSDCQLLFLGKRTRYLWNENLFLFMMALAASIATHYYVTIMAFILCLSFVIVYFKRVFSGKRFLPLTVSILCALFIAVIPIAAARASGIPFERSMNWAMGVMNYTDPEEEATFNKDAYSEIEGKGVGEKIFRMGYCEVYGEERAYHIVLFTAGAAALWLLYRMGTWMIEKCCRKRLDKRCFDGHLPVVIASVLFMAVYASRAIGMPQLIAGSRLCAVEQMLILTVMVMPVDMLFSALGLLCGEVAMQSLAAFGVAGIYMAVLEAGVLHGSLYMELSRYNSAVMTTQSIIEELPKNSFTIVSATDELYQTIQSGYHEEWLTFLENCQKGNYKLPTEYVFFYVEKKPIAYAQAHLFQGPAWLISDNHTELFSNLESSLCPEIVSSQISPEMARKKLEVESNPWDLYKELGNRTIVESKAYEWCQRFSELYPYEWRVGYEDENFVCYYFKQEPHSPYNLAVGYEDKEQ